MSVPEPDPPRRSRAVHWLAAAVAVLSLGWAVWLLRDAGEGLRGALVSVDAGRLVAALALGLCAAALNGELLRLGLRPFIGDSIGRRELYALQFMGQLAKNLPGRVWGVALQIQRTRGRVPVHAWAAATALMHVGALICALGFSIVALLALRGEWAALAMVLVAGAACVMIAARLARRVGPLDQGAPIWKRALQACFTYDKSTVIAFAAVSTVSWVLYYIAWALLADSHPALGPFDGVRMAADYAIAWFVGYVALLTPSGLGVRELAFTALMHDYPPAIVALGAIAARVWMLLNEIVLAIATMLASAVKP